MCVVLSENVQFRELEHFNFKFSKAVGLKAGAKYLEKATKVN